MRLHTPKHARIRERISLIPLRLRALLTATMLVLSVVFLAGNANAGLSEDVVGDWTAQNAEFVDSTHARLGSSVGITDLGVTQEEPFTAYFFYQLENGATDGGGEIRLAVEVDGVSYNTWDNGFPGIDVFSEPWTGYGFMNLPAGTIGNVEITYTGTTGSVLVSNPIVADYGVLYPANEPAPTGVVELVEYTAAFCAPRDFETPEHWNAPNGALSFDYLIQTGFSYEANLEGTSTTHDLTGINPDDELFDAFGTFVVATSADQTATFTLSVDGLDPYVVELNVGECYVDAEPEPEPEPTGTLNEQLAACKAAGELSDSECQVVFLDAHRELRSELENCQSAAAALRGKARGEALAACADAYTSSLGG